MVPNGWISTKLNAISSLVTKGATPTTYGYDFVDQNINTVRFIGAYNCTYEGKFKSNSGKWLSKEADLMLKRSKLKNGDSIICIVGNTIGSSFLVEDHILPANINQNVALIRPILEMVDPLYLQTWITSSYIQWQVKVEASTQAQPSLSLQQVGDFKINLPPLLEQQKIAQILSTWDRAISVTEKLLKNSQQQKKALMQQLLTGKKRLLNKEGIRFSGEWKDYHLNKIAEVIVSPVDKKSEPDELPVELCNYTDVYYNNLITRKINFMKATAKEAEIEKYKLKKGDVIITKDSETPGDIAIPALVSEDLNGVVCGYHLAIIRPKDKLIDGAFLNYLFSMQKTRYYFFTLATGATRFGLSIGGINKAHFKTPSRDEQQKIAEVVSLADQEVETLFKKLDCLKQEKKALMQQLLTGKKRVKVAA